MILKTSFSLISNFSRLDNALSEILNISRNQISNLINLNLVKVNLKQAKKSLALNKFDLVEIFNITSESTLLDLKKSEVENLNIDVIYENENFLILNKPKDLVVHAAPSVKDATLVDYLKLKNYRLSNLSGEERYGIVHRLDKDTSGAILIAKNNPSHHDFSNRLRNKEIGRIYICIIDKPLKNNCFVECHMGRNPKDRLKMASLDSAKYPNARYSKSEFRKILESKNKEYEIIGARLFTGRTHQIRVHLNTLNRFIYGDGLYSPKILSQNYKYKMLLHASVMYFKSSFFVAKIHKDLIEFMNLYFEDYENIVEKTLLNWQEELEKELNIKSNLGSEKYENIGQDCSQDNKKIDFRGLRVGQLF